MNRENIVRMAREVWTDIYDVESYERFAALVAAAEREACAKVCEMEGYKYRERASELDPIKRNINPEVARIANMTCDFNAAAIRARGQKHEKTL